MDLEQIKYEIHDCNICMPSWSGMLNKNKYYVLYFMQYKFLNIVDFVVSKWVSFVNFCFI